MREEAAALGAGLPGLEDLRRLPHTQRRAPGVDAALPAGLDARPGDASSRCRSGPYVDPGARAPHDAPVSPPSGRALSGPTRSASRRSAGRTGAARPPTATPTSRWRGNAQVHRRHLRRGRGRPAARDDRRAARAWRRSTTVPWSSSRSHPAPARRAAHAGSCDGRLAPLGRSGGPYPRAPRRAGTLAAGASRVSGPRRTLHTNATIAPRKRARATQKLSRCPRNIFEGSTRSCSQKMRPSE